MSFLTKLLALGLLWSGVSSAAIAFVQSKSGGSVSTTSVAVTYTSNNTLGNTLILFLRMSTTSQTVTMSDTLSNTFVQAATQQQTTDGHTTYLFYVKNCKAGANTVTATFSGTNTYHWLAAYEYSGLDLANPLDQTATAQGTTTAISVGPTSATNTANELVFLGVGFPGSFTGTVTSGSGYTLGEQNLDAVNGSYHGATETATVTATGAQTAAMTASAATNWSGLLATFREASATGTVSGTRRPLIF
jgi:hypothetical protein